MRPSVRAAADRTGRIVGLSVLVLAILAFAIAQHFMGSLTIPVMNQMAADTAASRSTSQESPAFPVPAAPEAPPNPGIPRVAPGPDSLLGEVHLSAGDSASRPANPTPADPLHIGFAIGVPSSVRVTVTADDGAVVATVLENPAAAAGSRVVDWNGTGAAGAPVPGGRYTVGVAAIEDVDVYRMSVNQLHVYVGRPSGGSGAD